MKNIYSSQIIITLYNYVLSELSFLDFTFFSIQQRNHQTNTRSHAVVSVEDESRSKGHQRYVTLTGNIGH